MRFSSTTRIAISSPRAYGEPLSNDARVERLWDPAVPPASMSCREVTPLFVWEATSEGVRLKGSCMGHMTLVMYR